MQDPNNSPELGKRLAEIDFPGLLKRLAKEREVFDNLWKRFNRDMLNIGVVGRARQGKSTLLQSLTGLSDDEIPSSDGLPCTSVQSIIYHHPEDRTYAKVYLYSEEEFIEEVIAPYYQELSLGKPPRLLKEFRKPLPPQPINPPNPAKAESVYKHLRDDYHAHIDKYEAQLQGKPREIKIPKEEIREYVSQKYDAQNNPLFFNHLAVRKVEIFCRFPHVNVEKIGLVDMPGLGDTRLGDEERMIKRLWQRMWILFSLCANLQQAEICGKRRIQTCTTRLTRLWKTDCH